MYFIKLKREKVMLNIFCFPKTLLNTTVSFCMLSICKLSELSLIYVTNELNCLQKQEVVVRSFIKFFIDLTS